MKTTRELALEAFEASKKEKDKLHKINEEVNRHKYIANQLSRSLS